MSNSANRRSFFRDATMVAAGMAGGLAGGFFPLRAPAIEPIGRNGTPKFKFSLAGYSYNRLLSGNPPKLTLDDFLADCARFGLDAADPTCYYFPKEVTREYLCHLKSVAFRLGLSFSGTAVANDFCYPAGPDRDKQIAYVKKWIEYAEILGAPVIRVYSGKVRGSLTVDEAYKAVAEAMEECCDFAGKHGVFLSLENHGGLTATVEGTLRILRDVKSPWFGMLMDTGNFHSADIYGDLAKIAPYTINTHVKVLVSGPDGKKVPTDLKRIAKILKDAGYRGYILLEYEENEDPREACPRYIEKIREAFAAG